MGKIIRSFVLGVCVLAASNSDAAIFGTVTGIVDPQHQAVGQFITIRAPSSGRQYTTDTDVAGRFVLQAVPTGRLRDFCGQIGATDDRKSILVRPGTVTEVGFALPFSAITETVDVVSTEGTVNTKSVTTESLVSRDELEHTPGALRTNSMDLVTQYVPGSYMVHDQLHVGAVTR